MQKIITSLQNPAVKNVMLLIEKPRARREQNRIMIEGLREVRLAIAGGFAITDLFCSAELLAEDDLALLLQDVGGMEPTRVSREVFNRMAYREDSGGVIALAEPKKPELGDLSSGGSPLFLVLESVEKPGNLGALLRTADAAGLDGVIICDPQTDIYNPNAIRSSIGCIFTMSVVTTTSGDAIAWLKGKGISVFGTALTASRFYHQADFTGPSAIVMGSEANGLSETWLKAADELILIPMRGKVDSMNVSASAAVVIFEAMRQRDFKPSP